MKPRKWWWTSSTKLRQYAAAIVVLTLLTPPLYAKPTIRKGELVDLSEESTDIEVAESVNKNVQDSVSSSLQQQGGLSQAKSTASLSDFLQGSVTDPNALKVCVMTADFWGLKSAGGTATAYHLLAELLAKSHGLQVTFLGVTKKESLCKTAKTLQEKPNLKWECLEAAHFKPEVVETYPYEQLSHAVLKWLQEDPERCDVIHGHEWGGAFVDLVTMINLRQISPGLRMAVEPHGGHFWSSQGQAQRPMDVVSLRIDNQERMVNQLNDIMISPTNYMISFLRQRGWTLPKDVVTIPNIIPEVEPQVEKMLGEDKPVWRLAFFSRLEERKGIKLFVEAISHLNVSHIPNFEVVFVGTEAKIDMRPSTVWLKEKTAHWSFKKDLKVGVKRDEALETLQSEGTLLVLCSLIDNMPYVVAEAAVKGIPFLAFDAGGVLEMFSGKTYKSNVIFEPTVEALIAKLDEVVQRGTIKAVRLNEKVTSGRQQWQQFHSDFAKAKGSYEKEDIAIGKKIAAKIASSNEVIKVVELQENQHALDLWEGMCEIEGTIPEDPVLLLPPSYVFAGERKTIIERLAEVYWANVFRGGSAGALTFGSVLPNGKVAFSTSPTWMIYAGDDKSCMDDTPVLIAQNIFCKVFTAESRVFRQYHSWVLAMLMGQQNYIMHSVPIVAFKVQNFTNYGYSCAPDKVPVDRKLTFPVASNLYKDSEELLRNLHMAPYTKPIVSLIDDFPTHQRHKGWQFGYLINDTAKQIQWLKWKDADNGLRRDGAWECGVSKHEYPKMHHSLLHPCAGQGPVCCGNSENAPFLLRYESFFHARSALLVLAYEVWPICGDGLDFVVRLSPVGNRKPSILLKRGYEADPDGAPNRQKIEWKLRIRTGDIIDFLVNPRGNHDCDGLYIVDIQIWADEA